MCHALPRIGLGLRLVAAATAIVAVLGATRAAPATAGTAGDLAPRSACPGESAQGRTPAQQETAMRCLIAYARRRHGLASFEASPTLGKASSQKVGDVIRCNQFSHTACGRVFYYWPQRDGFFRGATGLGENLAFGEATAGSPLQAMRMWLNSPPHRTTLLSTQFRLVGVAVRHAASFQGVPDAWVWVLEAGYHSP